MKRKILIIPLLLFAIVTMAETSLIIQPLDDQEQSNALTQIGYVKMMSDSLFVFSYDNFLLSKIAIKDVKHIYYGNAYNGGGVTTSVDNIQITSCKIYPNPTCDMLIIDNANCENVYIFDLNGRLLQTTHINGDHTTINVTNLTQGNYLLLLNNQTFKFIKQ